MRSYILFAFAALTAGMANAQTTVTFLLNMQGLTVSPNGVHIAGTFQSPQWQPGATAMTDTDGDGVFEYTATVPTGTGLQFKFINGNAWGSGIDEGVPADCGVPNGQGGYNRTFAPTGAIGVYGPVCFASCVDCPASPTAQVTFAVNMSQSTVSPNGVFVVGVPQTDPAFTQAMTDANGDGVYTATLTLDTNQTIYYKFQNGLALADAEVVPAACRSMFMGQAFRRLILAYEDTTTSTVCYGDCIDCIVVTPTIDVTLRVNMAEQTISPNGVHVMGNFQGWDPAATPMTDADGDGVYEVTVSVDENANLLYKFLNGNTSADAENVPSVCGLPDGFGAYNRVLELGTTNVTASTVCYGQCSDCQVVEVPVNVTFLVNMANETVSPDGVFFVGDIQNWSAATTPMTDADGDGIYEVTLSAAANTIVQFKFLNGIDFTFAEAVPATCGVDDSNGGFNRTFLVGAMDSVVFGPICFGTCADCEVIVEPTLVDVTFRVNMANETVSANGVHIVGNFQGWDPTTSNMTDANSDGVYEFTATIEENIVVDYHFINGNAWGADEEVVPSTCGVDNGLGGFNRSITLSSNDTILSSVCFSACIDCLPVSIVIITLNVDMSNQTVTNDEVFVAGSFNNWVAADGAMISLGNGIYQLPIAVNSGETFSYKFVNGTSWETVPADCGVSDGFGGYNRSHTAATNNEEIPVVCFNECAACIVVPTVNFTLTVDMSQQTISATGVFVAGTFNGFSPSATPMTEISPALYRAVVTVGQNELQYFKFLNGSDFAGAETVPFECGVADGFGGYNRSVTTNQNNITMPQVCFGSCASCAFSVNETSEQQLLVYPNPATDVVNIQGTTPAQSVRVFNAMGTLILEVNGLSTNVQLNTQDWSSGLYHAVVNHEHTATFIVR
jgi:hypothetical protein